MPLTSQFHIPRRGVSSPIHQRLTRSLSPSPNSSPLLSDEGYFPSTEASHEASPQSMPRESTVACSTQPRYISSDSLLAPSAFSQTDSQPQICGESSHRGRRRLWNSEELLPSPPSRKHRSRRERAQTTDERSDQENVAPQQTSVTFRQPRSTLRFGICFSSRSSSFGGEVQQKERAGRLSPVRSLLNPKE